MLSSLNISDSRAKQSQGGDNMRNNIPDQERAFEGKTRKTLIRRLMVSSIIASMGVGVAPSVGAQQADSENVELEEITVTGSRLVRTDLTAPSPTVVLDSASVRASGNFTIEETLNEFPQLVPDNTASVNSPGGSGVLTANLRGLGATRTLVLVNGRRFIPADANGLVDLTSIPDALVERVEIITGGASAVYGSDAIAGAVNFILKEDYEGIEASYQYGSAFEGDANTHKADLTMGATFDDERGSAMLSMSFTDRSPAFFADREFSEISLFDSGGVLVPGGSGNIPGTRIGLTSTQLASLNGVNLNPSGSCSGVTGVRFGQGGEVLPFCDPEDRFNFAPLNYLLRPLQRWQISSVARYNLTDNIELFAEGYFINTQNEFQQAPAAFAPQTTGQPNGTFLLPNFATNPLLPDPVRDFLSANTAIFDPDGDGTAAIIGAGRRGVETGPRNFAFDRTSWNVTAGFRGDVTLGGNDFRWETFYQFQSSAVSENFQGEISSLRLTLGTDVVVDPDTGEVVCRNNFIGCVPVNILGLDSISPEAAAFIAPPHGNRTEFQRQVIGGSITGDVFELPAGPVPVALGFEWRDEEFVFRPSPADAAGEFFGGPLPPNDGTFDLFEVFGETRIPIITDQPFFEELALEGAVRVSDYSTIGSVFTWKVGGEWAPVDWFRFRGAYNRAIRAPSLNELFATQSFGFTDGSDPCDIDNNPSQAQRDLCVTQGVSAADIDTFEQIGLGFLEVGGGNPDLEEERSKTLTVGAIISPPGIEGLNITVDYYKVTVDNAISNINSQLVIDTCFALLDPNSVFCNAVSRISNGQLDRVQATLQNIASLEVDGIDVQVDYAFGAPGLVGDDGQVTMQAVLGWQFKDEQTPFEGQAPIDCAGFFDGICSGQGTPINPGFRGILNVGYASGPLSTRVQTRYINGLDIFPGRTAAVTEVDPEVYIDISASYQIGEGLELFGGIDNLFDNQPPVLGFFLAGDSNTDPSLYDTIGRRFFIGARATF